MRRCGRGFGIRRAGGTVAIALGVGLAVICPGLTAGAAPVSPAAPGPSTTTTTEAPTTTAPPATTTTTVPATTTAPPTSTSSTHPARTTTTPSTTTPHKTSTSSNTPWALIAVIVVLVVAIVLVALLIRSRRKKGVEAEWHRAVVPALSDAQLARDAVLSDNAMSGDPTLRGAVDVQVERAAVALERAARAAPDAQAAGLATEAAGSLRGPGLRRRGRSAAPSGSLRSHRRPVGRGRRGPAGPEFGAERGPVEALHPHRGSLPVPAAPADRRRPESIGPGGGTHRPPPPMSSGANRR